MLSYTELTKRTTLEARFRYAMLGGSIGIETFGSDRPLNQKFYASRLWKQLRDEVIIRDEGCDLGVPGHHIMGRILVHHMNPIQIKDLDPAHFNKDVLNAEYLITVSTQTHNAIHFGDEKQLPRPFVERRPGDTTLW